MGKAPVMVRGGCEVGVCAFEEVEQGHVCAAEQSVGPATNTLTAHLLADFCLHSENQGRVLEIFPFGWLYQICL